MRPCNTFPKSPLITYFSLHHGEYGSSLLVEVKNEFSSLELQFQVCAGSLKNVIEAYFHKQIVEKATSKAAKIVYT